MTHYYTHGVPSDIARALNEIGMPLKRSDIAPGVLAPTYAEAHDWMMENGILIGIQWYRSDGFKWDIDYLIDGEYGTLGYYEDDINYLPNWYAAMNEAITRAVRILREKETFKI